MMKRYAISALAAAGLLVSASVFAADLGSPITLDVDSPLAAKQIASGGLIAHTAVDGTVLIDGKQSPLPAGTTAIGKVGIDGNLCFTSLIRPSHQDILGSADQNGCLGTALVIPGRQSMLLVEKPLQAHGDAQMAMAALMTSSFIQGIAQATAPLSGNR